MKFHLLLEKLYDNAKKLLEDEVSLAMGKPLKEVESTIHTKLEPPGAAIKVKKIIEDEEDEDDSLMDDVNSDSKSRSRDDSDTDDDSDADDAGDMGDDDYDDGADDEEF